MYLTVYSKKIEKEPESSCIYKCLNMDYTYGLDLIYKRQKTEKAKKSSFGRECDLQYLGLICNTSDTAYIDRTIFLDKKYKISNKYAHKGMGIDSGFGSSHFELVVIQFSDCILQVPYVDEFERQRYENIWRYD